MKKDLYDRGESGIVPFSVRFENRGVGSTFFFLGIFDVLL